jgi:hypothetical protein
LKKIEKDRKVRKDTKDTKDRKDRKDRKRLKKIEKVRKVRKVRNFIIRLLKFFLGRALSVWGYEKQYKKLSLTPFFFVKKVFLTKQNYICTKYKKYNNIKNETTPISPMGN